MLLIASSFLTHSPHLLISCGLSILALHKLFFGIIFARIYYVISKVSLFQSCIYRFICHFINFSYQVSIDSFRFREFCRVLFIVLCFIAIFSCCFFFLYLVYTSSTLLFSMLSMYIPPSFLLTYCSLTLALEGNALEQVSEFLFCPVLSA